MMSMFIVIPLLATVGVLIVIVNLLTLATIFASPQLLKPANYPIISFLITALVQGFVVVPTYCIKRLDFAYKPNWICDVFRFPYFVCGHLLTLNLVLVCIDRIIAIKLPLRYESIITRFSMISSICVETVVVVIVDLLPFGNASKRGQCVYNPWPSWSVTVIVLTIFVPLVFLVLTYVWIWLIALRVADEPQRRKCNRRASIKTKISQRVGKILELRATKTASLLVGVFVICWGPIAIYYLVENVCGRCITQLFSKTTQYHVGFVVKILSFISSIISPFAYCWRTREFQKEFQKSLNRRHWRAAGIALIFVRRAAKERAAMNNSNLKDLAAKTSSLNGNTLSVDMSVRKESGESCRGELVIEESGDAGGAEVLIEGCGGNCGGDLLIEESREDCEGETLKEENGENRGLVVGDETLESLIHKDHNNNDQKNNDEFERFEVDEKRLPLIVSQLLDETVTNLKTTTL